MKGKKYGTCVCWGNLIDIGNDILRCDKCKKYITKGEYELFVWARPGGH